MRIRNIPAIMTVCLFIPFLLPAGEKSSNRPVPSNPPVRDLAADARLQALDQAAEFATPRKVTGKITRAALERKLGKTRETVLNLSKWTEHGATDFFALPRFSRTTEGYLQFKGSKVEPDNTFGFWQSEEFTIPKPADKSDSNALIARVEYSYSGVGAGKRLPTLRLRFNRTDFQDYAMYLYDGWNLDPAGGSGVITCKYDTNRLQTDRKYTLSLDYIYFTTEADPEATVTIQKASLIETGPPALPDFLVDGVWVEDDSDAKAWINGYRVALTGDCYDACYNDEIAAMIVTYSSSQGLYDFYVWANDKITWVNKNDTYQIAVAGHYVAYLENDGDVKVWNPFTDDFQTIKSNGYRISSSGGDALMIWDSGDDLYVWVPGEGMKEVDDNDIWFLCTSASVPIPH